MKVYMVCSVRDNRVETVFKVTKRLTWARASLLDTLEACGVGHLFPLSREEIEEDMTFKVSPELNIQLLSFNTK